MIAVRRGRPEDVALLSRSLARAFVRDPIAAYIFPDDLQREQCLDRFFTLQLRHNYLPRGEVFITERQLGAALWMPPRARPPRLRDRLADVWFAPVLGERLAATRRLTQLLEANHPVVPHYYLGTLGTDPAHQGRGFGTALLEPVLQRCDLTSLPCYLECSRLENVAFYARQGFAVTAEIHAPDAGPPLWLMWREPRREG